MNEHSIGANMMDFMRLLWPINRSITGAGLRETLRLIQQELPELNLIEVSTGAKVLDWTIPEEWVVHEARLTDPEGRCIADIQLNNLHLMGYSVGVDEVISLEELQAHLYSLPEQPDAIPYVTSYYKKNWGFCISHQVREALKPGNYHAYINASHIQGSLSIGELVIPGTSEQEVFISTYCCHPSMANNELSGPCLATFLAKWLKQQPSLKYTYRFVFIPEMIGSAAYLSLKKDHLKKHVVAGFNLTCVGDNRSWSYLPSRLGYSYSDRVAQHALKHIAPDCIPYTWFDRGSDESMYCAPGIDLPVVSVMRTKYGVYPEYHTSLDTLGDVVCAEGIEAAYRAHVQMFEMIEQNVKPIALVEGEPQLGPRGLYPSTSIKGSTAVVKDMLNLISLSDGQHTLLDIAEKTGRPFWIFTPILKQLQEHQIIRIQTI